MEEWYSVKCDESILAFGATITLAVKETMSISEIIIYGYPENVDSLDDSKP